jgi:hypothetical protein
MSWLFSQALVAEYSAASCSDGERSVLSSENPTPQAFLPNDRMTDFSRPSRFGMTFGPLTESLGAAVLTWFLAGSRAKTSVLQGKAQASTARVAGSGPRWPASLAKYDHDTSSWRTPQFSLLGGLDEFSETWPRWGLMRDGECWALPTPALRTFESESGLLPTPNVPNGGRSVKHVTDWRGKSAYHNGKKVQVGLESVLGGAPHPTYLEWLMGWPLGWTDIKPRATAKFQEWRQQHGGFSVEKAA